MSEADGDWVADALAEQEEYLKRQRSCSDVPGKPHAFRPHGRPSPDGSIANAALWSQCVACGVTASGADYARKVGPR